MNKLEKMVYLTDNHFNEWMDARRLADERVSKVHSMWCVCGKLCTGMHERSCKRFRNKVDSETLKDLKHLIKK